MPSLREMELFDEVRRRDVLLGITVIVLLGGVYVLFDYWALKVVDPSEKPIWGSIILGLALAVIANLIPVVAVSLVGFFYFRRIKNLREEESRDTRAREVKNAMKELLEERFGAQYLNESSLAIEAFKRLVNEAQAFVYVLGSKSTASGYLALIRDKLLSGRVPPLHYYRLLTGDHITHELHEHLDELLSEEAVAISWLPSEKYGSFIITEDGVAFALPTPRPTMFRGLLLSESSTAVHYSQYFISLFMVGDQLKTPAAVKIFCETCSPNTAHNAERIKQELASIGHKP